jgi:hypothetical protein
MDHINLDRFLAAAKGLQAFLDPGFRRGDCIGEFCKNLNVLDYDYCHKQK